MDIWGKINCVKKALYKKNLYYFNTTVPTSECIVHLEGFHVHFESRCNDPIKMDYPLRFVDLENYEPADKNVESFEMWLDLKENVILRRIVDREGVFAHVSRKDSHANILQHVEASIISFPTTWMMESGLPAFGTHNNPLS